MQFAHGPTPDMGDDRVAMLFYAHEEKRVHESRAASLLMPSNYYNLHANVFLKYPGIATPSIHYGHVGGPSEFHLLAPRFRVVPDMAHATREWSL